MSEHVNCAGEGCRKRPLVDPSQSVSGFLPFADTTCSSSCTMPTSTATMTSPGRTHSSSVLSLNSKPLTTPAESSTAATLRSLYPRAAKAFLHRDFALTLSLLGSAFALIAPPTYSPDDEIALFRRKWDVLRITVETTVYCSPPSLDGADTLPESLLANQLLSPPSLVAMLHTRSLNLFTPSSPPQKPLSMFLPHQVLTTLILSSIKLTCYEFGRSIVEDWLAGRQQDRTKDGQAGYSKVIELYCLQILPRLEEWEYAQEFLAFERELQDSVRTVSVCLVDATECEQSLTILSFRP
jgi:hypothetical protein